jgi:hypothetical protein
MSADNAIGILRTKDGYRVKHIFSSEDIYWDHSKKDYSDEPNLDEIYKKFHRGWFFTIRKKAFKKAFELLGEVGYTEYGIQEFDFRKIPFPKKSLLLEIEDIVEDVGEDLQNHPETLSYENWKFEIVNRTREIMKNFEIKRKVVRNG